MRRYWLILCLALFSLFSAAWVYSHVASARGTWQGKETVLAWMLSPGGSWFARAEGTLSERGFHLDRLPVGEGRGWDAQQTRRTHLGFAAFHDEGPFEPVLTVRIPFYPFIVLFGGLGFWLWRRERHLGVTRQGFEVDGGSAKRGP